MEDSRREFTKGAAPLPRYTDGAGTTRTINAEDRRVRELRDQLDYERWNNREYRRRSYFGGYYTGAPVGPVVFYRDPFSDWFWWWLIAQSLDTRANWAYHHRSDMDAKRYEELVRRDAALDARVKELEAKGVARNSSYRPPELPASDLMYTDDYLKAVYNPQPPPGSSADYHDDIPARPVEVQSTPAGPVLLKILIVFAILVFFIWLVFLKRWGGG